MTEASIYMAVFHGDRISKKITHIPSWVIPIQVGAVLTGERIAKVTDNTGQNISQKYDNYSELTALYWIWKNVLNTEKDLSDKYYGLFNYRHWQDMKGKDIKRVIDKNADVFLPYPKYFNLDINEHHIRYIKKTDWTVLLKVLRQIQPSYYINFEEIFTQQLFYSYNSIIAKGSVLKSYCEWLFPILEEIEELSEPKAAYRSDRYLGYIGENLLTLYFIRNKKKLNILKP